MENNDQSVETTPAGKTGTDDSRNPIGGGNQQKSGETVDGYSDASGETKTGSPDPGTESKLEPLSPDEYAEAQKEARSEE